MVSELGKAVAALDAYRKLYGFTRPAGRRPSSSRTTGDHRNLAAMSMNYFAFFPRY
jgi:hypothetical protein